MFKRLPTYKEELKENCESIQLDDIQEHERTTVECRSTVDQIALKLCPDGEWRPGCRNIFSYDNDSHVAEMRLKNNIGTYWWTCFSTDYRNTF